MKWVEKRGKGGDREGGRKNERVREKTERESGKE